MDFRDAPEEAQFRADLRAWLAREVAHMSPMPVALPERAAWWRPWQRRLHDAGFAGLAWPREYGGRGANVLQQAIFLEECDRAGAPERLDVFGAGMAGPTIIEFGTPVQKVRYLDRILRGEDLWCQLFSEPGAGSDLAALRTRAEKVDGGWRIHGQKVWTSGAQIAEYAILLARTGEPGGRHKGISFFLLPMRQRGVTVRPLRHMLGGAEFNEVFLDGAEVDSDGLVGEIGAGWRVAMATLGYERAAIATGRVNLLRLLENLITLIRETKGEDGCPLGQDSFVRQRVAELYARMALQRLTGKRILSTLAEGGAPGPESSTAKLFTAPLVEEVCDFALSLIGLGGQEDPETADPVQARWLRLSYQARGTSIAGGTTFVQRNILAERALGLPKN
jgi:alkylation response protein AidB-like acyl-CoA dehydrogenase